MKVRMTKKSPGMKAAQKAPKGAGVTEFNLQDNGDETYTVLGADAAGNTFDISGVASITATSDNPAVVAVDTPGPTTFGAHAAQPAPSVGATAKVSVTATWTDGSVGPFTIDLGFTIQAGPVSGIVAVPSGAPTVH